MARMLIGVDEAGRGPLAGPVAVGAVIVSASFDITKHFPDAADSKLLSEESREDIYARMRAHEREGNLQFVVRFSSPLYIDRFGIAPAVRSAVFRSVRALAPEAHGVRVLLDGSLKAPEAYEQKTIIGGDRLEPLISLASIAAKVRRDRLMRLRAKKYPVYGFEVHKGYGTKAHRSAIKQHGPCELHRKTFKLT